MRRSRYYVLWNSDDESDRSLDKHTIVRFSDVQKLNANAMALRKYSAFWYIRR